MRLDAYIEFYASGFMHQALCLYANIAGFIDRNINKERCIRINGEPNSTISFLNVILRSGRTNLGQIVSVVE